MPRISKKNKAELLEALYKSDSDDDDDLLMSSVHLQPSQRSPDSSIDDDMPLKVSIELPAKSSTKPSAPVETKEKFEERAKRLAKDKAHLFHVEQIDHPSLLGWTVRKKKNTQIITAYLPCGIRANHDERMDIGQKFDQHHELIRYVGVHYKGAGLLERVTQNNIVPYYGHADGPDDTTCDRTVWSPKLLQMHLESMRTRPEFQENTELKLRVEELALQYMLNEVLARHEANECKAAAAASAAAEMENVPPKLSPPVWKSPPPADGSPKPATPTHNPFAAAIEDRPKQKLRAGDVIAYFHPVMQRERCQGTIVTVNPPRSKEHNIAIEMEDSTLLPPSCHVKLVLRRLNKKFVEPRDKRAFFEEISAFQLDPSQNGKIQAVTKADELGRAYRDMQNELKDCQDDFWRDNAKRKQKDTTENVKDDDDTAGENECPSTPERSSKSAAVATPVEKLSQSQGSVVSKTESITKPSPRSRRKSAISKAQRPPRRPVDRSPKRKAPPKETKPAWIDGMEELLAEVRKNRSMKRHPEKLYAKEEALKVAIQARLKLEGMGRREKNSKEELLDELKENFAVPKKRLRGFLNGDRNNLIKVEDLMELTDKWKTWLSNGSAQGAAADKEPSEGASKRIDVLEPSARLESAFVGPVEDAATDKLPIEDAAVPTIDLDSSAQQESDPGENRASTDAVTGDESIEGVSPPIDCSESFPQQSSASSESRAGDHVATEDESIRGATLPIDCSEPSTQVPAGTRTSEQAPPEHTYLVTIQRLKEMASDQSRLVENAKRKCEQLNFTLSVWKSLVEESCQRGTDVDDLISRLAADIQKPEDSLRTFLHGNANDAMNTDELEEFNVVCQKCITNITENVPIWRVSMPSSPKKKQRLD